MVGDRLLTAFPNTTFEQERQPAIPTHGYVIVNDRGVRRSNLGILCDGCGSIHFLLLDRCLAPGAIHLIHTGSADMRTPTLTLTIRQLLLSWSTNSLSINPSILETFWYFPADLSLCILRSPERGGEIHFQGYCGCCIHMHQPRGLSSIRLVGVVLPRWRGSHPVMYA